MVILVLLVLLGLAVVVSLVYGDLFVLVFFGGLLALVAFFGVLFLILVVFGGLFGLWCFLLSWWSLAFLAPGGLLVLVVFGRLGVLVAVSWS